MKQQKGKAKSHETSLHSVEGEENLEEGYLQYLDLSHL